MSKDVMLSVLSDMHSGSVHALFPNRFWEGKYQNYTPTEKNRRTWEHFRKCAEYARAARKDKRLLIVHNGDAIEGVHHASIDVVTRNKDEQAEIHIELMDWYMRKARFITDDKLYYVKGTECHVEDKEHEIGKDLGAQKTKEGLYAFDHLELEINGRLVWFVHHGKGRGSGANEGNALRNWMRDIYFDCQKLSIRPPDLVISGHTHTPAYNTHVVSRGNGYHVTHGIICPSWQSKTRFAYRVAPVEVNQIGAVFVEIRSDGEIRPPVIMTMDTESKQSVKF
jgi:predicted phosphodiesterase